MERDLKSMYVDELRESVSKWKEYSTGQGHKDEILNQG